MRGALVCSVVALLATTATVSAAGAAEPVAKAAARPSLPGAFAVKGAPLVKRGRVRAGRSVSVYARPVAVAVDGCRTRGARVRSRRAQARVSARLTCTGVKGGFSLKARIAGRRMRGTIAGGGRKRRFAAALRVPPGALLTPRKGRALAAVRDSDELARHPDTEISAAGDAQIARTELVVSVERSATVAQVNAALRSVGGRIAGSLDGSPRLIVAIPDPGSLAALDAVRARLARRRGIERVARAEMSVNFVLPPNVGSPVTPANATALSHLLAMRAPAAWNARRAIKLAERPTLIVSDKFGDGALSSHVDAVCPGCVFGTGNPEPASHGYHVVGIAAGSFANDGTPRGLVTGVFPAQTRLEVVDLMAQTVGAGVVRTLQAVKATPGRVVLNTSWGHSEVSDRDSRDEGEYWALEIRDSGLAGRLVHAASAGNEARPAELFSEWNAAALRTDLVDEEGAGLPRPSNTLITENLVDSGAPRFESQCRALSSNTGGQIAAVGTDVFSHIKRREGSSALVPAGAGDLTGTSQASPQVAALAEYAWSIAPDLTPSQIAALLIATAQPPVDPAASGCVTQASAPRLDAYAAVLSLDQAAAVTPAGAPVRLAILDRTEDGIFNGADLAAHATAIAAGSQGQRDWGRSDLNGDGFTGVGESPARFDLDPSDSTRAGPPSYGPSETQTIEGAAVAFNENQVSDLEVLCYYAYSGLFAAGDSGQRTALLTTDLKGCGHPLTIDPATATVAPGASVQLTATVAAATDATVAWAANAGSITQTGLYTAPSAPGTYVVAATDVTDPTRSATATVTVLDSALSGKFNGESTLCETEPVLECFEAENTKALLQVTGDEFTLFWRSARDGHGTSYPTADCYTQPGGPTCIKFVGTRSGSSYTGLEADADPAHSFEATLTGDVLSGRIDDPPNGNGDFIEFSLTHDPT